MTRELNLNVEPGEYKPDKVLFGDICLNNLGPPSQFPTRYALVSLTIIDVSKIIRNAKPCSKPLNHSIAVTAIVI